MKPVICNYYLTYRCNARCSFCSIWNSAEVSMCNESPPVVVTRNCTDARALGVKIVDFTGGEPLLYSALPEVLAHARSIGLRTTLTTNGILYPERARELASLIDILQFSLDGADRETHDSVKGVPCFDRVMESIECARSLGDRPTLIHTVTDSNLACVPDVISLARRLKALVHLNPCFSYFGNRGFSPENIPALDRLSRGPGVTVDRGFLLFLRDGGNRRSAPRCRAVSSVIVISPDDRLILPCFHFRTQELPIGDCLIELRNSPIVRQAMKEEGKFTFCEGCTVYCYIRASLFQKPDRYSLASCFSGAKYLFEYTRSPKSPSNNG